MTKSWLMILYRLTVMISAGGILIGEGCIGPNDLRSQFLASFNSLVYRAMELFLADIFGVPLEA